MRNSILGVAVAAALVLCGAAAGIAAGEHQHDPAATATATKQTMQGEVLDMACYMASGERGEKHKSCAQMCVQGGAPMGILTSDGKVVLLVEDHAAAKPYAQLKEKAGDQVKVTGTYVERGGLPALVVAAVESVK
jgi:hypothetical protein